MGTQEQQVMIRHWGGDTVARSYRSPPGVALRPLQAAIVVARVRTSPSDAGCLAGPVPSLVVENKKKKGRPSGSPPDP